MPSRKTSFRLFSGLIALSLALLPTLTLTAQEPTPTPTVTTTPPGSATITVDGSRIISPVLQNARTNYAATSPDAAKVNVDVQVNGTEGGFEKLCNNTLDIAMAVRGISDAELARCQAASVQFVEVLLGYNALVAVVNPGSKVECVEPTQLIGVLSGSAPATDWQQTAAELESSPIGKGYIVAKPDDPNANVRTLAGTVLTLDGSLRADLTAFETPLEPINFVASDPTAFAILTLQQLGETEQRNVKVLKVRNGTSCVEPSVPNLDEARYPLSQSLYVYINAASLNRPEVKPFADYLLSSDGRRAIRDAKFSEASQTVYDRGLNYVSTKQVGRTFTRIQAVNVPAETIGTITIDGAASPFSLFNQITNSFKPRFNQITVTATAYGDDEAYRKLCANTVDVVIGSRQPNDPELGVCQSNNVQIYRLPAGGTGVILLSNPADTYAQCLKVDQLAKIFSNEAPAKAWNEVDPAFPANPLTVLAPTDGKSETDFLMTRVKSGTVAPLMRTDTVQNDDALYRAAGIRNLTGGITYLTYADYVKATEAAIEMKPVAIDSGNGCVAPSADTIRDGSYALAQNYILSLNVNSFTRPEVKAYVWYLIGDDALSILGNAGLTGVDTAAFATARDFALERFNPAATPAPTATPIPVEPTAIPTVAPTATPLLGGLVPTAIPATPVS